MGKLKENFFDVSDSNMVVLETIPRLMADAKYRKKLRRLVITFLLNKKREGVVYSRKEFERRFK